METNNANLKVSARFGPTHAVDESKPPIYILSANNTFRAVVEQKTIISSQFFLHHIYEIKIVVLHAI
jgi:hypothetical protein